MTSVAAVRLRRARDLLRRGRGYLDENGMLATARKVADWSLRRVIRDLPPTTPDRPGTGVGHLPVYRFAPLPDRLTVPRADWQVGYLQAVGTRDTASNWPEAIALGSVDAAHRAVLARELDVLLVGAVPWSDRVRRLLRVCAERHVPTAFEIDPALHLLEPTPVQSVTPQSPASSHNVRASALRSTLSACRFALVADDRAQALARADKVRIVRMAGGETAAAVAGRVVSAYLALHRPKVSIVSILYKKAHELPLVLQSYERQSYGGAIEVVFVDDCSPDDSVAVVEAFRDRQRRRPDRRARLDIRVLRNEANRGNCISRNVGIHAASGDLIVVIDADCALNRDFVQAHVAAHAFDDCEVVLGPHDIDLQDAERPDSFLNCVTRNFSIKREALPELLFDPLPGTSAESGSAFGWEDVELGYRLWRDGARIKFTADAISVHQSADPVPDGLVARRSSAPAVHLKQKHLRVLSYRWHIPHQVELWKLPIDVTLVTGIGSPMTESWDFGQRPMPGNARFAPIGRIDPRDYDLAIVHFDENVLAPENTNGVIGQEWGAAFRHFRERVDLPQIAICHGTPQFRGQYDFGYSEPDLLQTIESERKRLVDYLGDVHVVCNSHQAQREWGFRRSSVIWHGFDPRDFPPATYQRGILSPLDPLVLSRPHYRGFFLYRSVFAGLEHELRPETLLVPEPHPGYDSPAYAAAKYRRYVDEIRRYSIYFNPTLRSPMPRARAEPMMCGVVTVSADNHDVSMFIENGVDGFYSNEPGELREYLRYLLHDPAVVRRIGQASRAKAIKAFHIDRYLADWRSLLASLV